ncbi:MAG TPA: MFS transporter [Actinophytocola sp.]|uniref:MFS transporter n=1 Tax=Actinophytocola sp. TaxID=1872138 RepID=UPI002DBC5AA7|nr:MFS transporter [Actinophytocola sp.]HEU5475949.1 MFS transporter [Actinophytocola sp.]
MARDPATTLPRDVYITGVARGMSTLGTVVVVTALLLDLHNQHAGSWIVAGVLFAGTLPIVLLAPVIGRLTDRYDGRGLIIITGLWQAATCVLITLVSHPAAILSLVALNAFGAAVAQPVFGTLIRAMVTDDRLAAANSVQQSGHILAQLGGAPVSALLTGLTGSARIPLLLAAAGFLAISGAGLLIRTRRRPHHGGVRIRLRDGMTVLLADRTVAAAVILTILLVLVVHVLYVAQVYLVRDTLGASEFVFGLLQAAHFVGLLVGTAIASRLTTMRGILIGIPVAAATMSFGILLIGTTRSLPATFPLYIMIGIGGSIGAVAVGTLLLLRTPDTAVGRALAGFTALHRNAGLIAYCIAGLALGGFPAELVYLLAGIAAIIAVLAATPVLHRATMAFNRPVTQERFVNGT